MNPIPVLIADDDPGMRLIMKKMIQQVEGFQLVGEAADGSELMFLVEETHPQVVFLDVEMPGKTGVECAKLIQDMNPAIVIIFATAHDEYMSDAFEVYAFDYLVKPFKVERVMKTLERARDRLRRVDDTPMPPMTRWETKLNGERMVIRHKDGVSFVPMQDILLVQREDRATVIYTAGEGRYVVTDSLGATEAKLDPALFYRCHKSYIINLDKISLITPYGRWTYVVRLQGTKQDALMTHEKYEELVRMFETNQPS